MSASSLEITTVTWAACTTVIGRASHGWPPTPNGRPRAAPAPSSLASSQCPSAKPNVGIHGSASASEALESTAVTAYFTVTPTRRTLLSYRDDRAGSMFAAYWFG